MPKKLRVWHPKAGYAKLVSCFLCSLLMVFYLGFAGFWQRKVFAGSGFNPGNIMSDAVMSNSGTLSVAGIDNFLRSKCSLGGSCLYAKYFNGRSAAQVIWQAAQDYRINPQVLLVLLQKEQSLVTAAATDTRLRKATGYGCPDTAACDARYYGFENQVRRAAELFRTVLDGGWSNYPAYTTRYIQYHPNAVCGGTNVYIENRATSALYRYTPYQPNAAALAEGGDGCSSYGNRNFYNLFTSWFGSTGSISATPVSSPADSLNSTYYLPQDVFVLQIGDNQALEFLGVDNETPALINPYHSGATQLFTLERDGKFYQIRHVYSGKYLDVSGAGTADGTRIQLYEQNSTCAQQWALEWDGENYEIRNACSAKNLDVKDGAINQSGNPVYLWVDNDTAAQKWTLQNALLSPLEEGIYSLGPSSEGIVVSLPGENPAQGVDLTTGVAATAASQRYQARRTAEGFYTFQNQLNGLFLDVTDASSNDGAAVHLWSENGTCAQKWLVERYNDGYHLRSSCSGKYLDISNGRISEAGIKVQIWTGNNTAAQLWYFKKPLDPLLDLGDSN